MLLDHLQTFLKDQGITVPLFDLAMLLLITMMGAVTHWFKLMMQQQAGSMWSYWKKNRVGTFTSFASVALSWWFLIEMRETSLIAFFFSGYFCDSTFNRLENYSRRKLSTATGEVVNDDTENQDGTPIADGSVRPADDGVQHNAQSH